MEREEDKKHMKEKLNKEIDIEHSLMVAMSLHRYETFVFFNKPKDKPMPFNKLMKDEDIDVVQLHSLQTYKDEGHEDIIGFVGAFEWKNNTLKPCDGDSYNPECLVYGYDWFKTKDNKRGLDILVGEDW